MDDSEPLVNGLSPCPQCIASCPSQQEILDCLKCEVLEYLRLSLIKFLNPDRHVDFLRSKYILSEEDCEEICCLTSRRKKASMFLDIISKKGGDAFDALCAALSEEGTQIFLLRQLNEDFERRYRMYRELTGQERQPEGLAPLTPPPLRPPPPRHRVRNCCQIQPSEHSSYFTSTSISPESDSCPGYPSIQFSVIRDRMEQDVEVQKSKIDMSKYLQSLPKIDVSQSLQSLTITTDKSATSNEKSFLDEESCSPDVQAELGSHQHSTTILSTIATGGTCRCTKVPLMDSFDLPTPSQKSPSLSVSDAVSQQPPLPRGLHGSSLVPGNSSDPLSLQMSRPEPVENEDDSVEEGFFVSLENQSLTPSSAEAQFRRSSILCEAALDDQQRALGKCAHSNDKPAEIKQHGNSSEYCDVRLVSHGKWEGENQGVVHAFDYSSLMCLSGVHSTDIKSVYTTSNLNSSQPFTDENSSITMKNEKVEQEKLPAVDKPLKFNKGLSKENRVSLHNKSGRGSHSSHC